jgi:hypothetical protein
MFEASHVLAITVAHYYVLLCVIQATLQTIYRSLK